MLDGGGERERERDVRGRKGERCSGSIWTVEDFPFAFTSPKNKVASLRSLRRSFVLVVRVPVPVLLTRVVLRVPCFGSERSTFPVRVAPAWQIASCFAVALWQEVASRAPRGRHGAAEDSGKRVGGCRQGEWARALFTSPTLLLPLLLLLLHHRRAAVGQYEPQLWFLHITSPSALPNSS